MIVLSSRATVFIALMSIGFISISHSATLLYKSDYSPAQTTLAVPDISGDAKGAWQHWTGFNAETGRREAITPFGASYSIFQMIIGRTVTPSTINDYIVNEIQRIPGPHGDTVYALLQNVKQIFPETWTQDACMILRDQPAAEVGDVYFSYWFKFQPDLLSKLGNSAGNDNWRMMSEWKTGGSTDYRVATIVEKDVETQRLSWNTVGSGWDTEGAHHDYWAVRDTTHAVPVGAWFKYEVFWSRGSLDGNDGRYWAAVNGRVIVDYHGSLFPDATPSPEKIDRIFLNNNYSGGGTPAQQWTTGLEIWDGFPCGEDLSCDTTDPMGSEQAAGHTGKLMPSAGIFAAPGGFRIEVNEAEAYRLVVADISGKVVLRKQGAGPDHFTVRPRIAQGMYFIKVGLPTGAVQQKRIFIR